MSTKSDEAILLQRNYYASTADAYDHDQVADDDEHMRALAFFGGFARSKDHGSVLDVGAGTGRAVRYLKAVFPASRIVGIEPVKELRDRGLQRGDLAPDELIDGDATKLSYPDNSFDWVVETGVLHHIKDYQSAVAEMCRVARVGVMISDANNMGQGGRLSRFAKQTSKSLGLWPLIVAIQTKGKGYKWNEGDGIYYSFSAFDCVKLMKKRFSKLYYINTDQSGYDLYRTSSSVCIIACAS